MHYVFTVGLAGITALAMPIPAQEKAPPPNQAIHGPRSIDQELDHLTKALELTPSQQKQIRPLLDEHHDRIQALLDKNPKLSRQDLAPQIHAISDQTHREIEALLTDHQKLLATAMVERMHRGEESRRPPPATLSK